MRTVIGLIVLVLAVLTGLTVWHYGTLDPCRMLAQDLADDGYGQVAKAMGMEPGETPDSALAMARMVTSQYTQSECVWKLRDRWFGIKPENH
ncbi:MAG: hypothetical protein V4441_08805 [Pseudomonadota bacterium]